MSWQVDEPLMPSLCSSAPVDTPGMARSTRNAVNLLAVDLGEDGEEIGEAAVGDELLHARQAIVAVRRCGIALVLAPSASLPEPGSVSA